MYEWYGGYALHVSGPEVLSSLKMECPSSVPHHHCSVPHDPHHSCCILMPMLTFPYSSHISFPLVWLTGRVWGSVFGRHPEVCVFWSAAWQIRVRIHKRAACWFLVGEIGVLTGRMTFLAENVFVFLGKCCSLAQTGTWTRTFESDSSN